jgi:hypothetical protein
MAAERKRKHEDGTGAVNNVCLWRGCASVVFDTVEELWEHVNTVHLSAKGSCLWGQRNGCYKCTGGRTRARSRLSATSAEQRFLCLDI